MNNKQRNQPYTLDQLQEGDRFYKAGDKSKQTCEVTGVIVDKHLGKVMTVYYVTQKEALKRNPNITANRKPQEFKVIFLRNIDDAIINAVTKKTTP